MKCEKVTYATKEKAHIAAKTIMRSGKKLRAYKCPKCYRFHLTSDVNGKGRIDGPLDN